MRRRTASAHKALARQQRAARCIRALMNLKLRHRAAESVPAVLYLPGASGPVQDLPSRQLFWYMPRPVRLIRPSLDHRATICLR